MNRLWVRLSLTFSLVILAVILIVGVSFRAPFSQNEEDSSERIAGIELNEAEREALQTLQDNQFFKRVNAEAAQQIPGALTYIVVVSGLAAIIAGVLMSRRLTIPLDTLQEAAQTIGTSNFSYRVQVKGTDEVMDLANAFNSMAAQLEEAEALRSNLLADVAHELRNPLHVIEGNLRAILDDVYPLSKEEIGHLFEQTQHLTRLVNDLHELAQAEAHRLTLAMTPTDMADLVQETAASFKAVAAAQGVTLQVQLLGVIPQLNVDSARIRQALSNLLSNALRYTPAAGEIMITAQQVAAPAQDVVAQDAVALSEVDDERLAFAISVADTGKGILPKHIPYIFNRFYRADSARSREMGGSGLGLAIVKAIIEEHDGQVTVVSEGKGKGSTFTLYLPVPL